MITDEEVPPQPKPRLLFIPKCRFFFQLSDHCQSPSVMEPEQKEPPGWFGKRGRYGFVRKRCSEVRIASQRATFIGHLSQSESLRGESSAAAKFWTAHRLWSEQS